MNLWNYLFTVLSILNVKAWDYHGHTNITAVSDNLIIEWRLVLIVVLIVYFLVCLCLLLQTRVSDESATAESLPADDFRRKIVSMDRKKNSY